MMAIGRMGGGGQLGGGKGEGRKGLMWKVRGGEEDMYGGGVGVRGEGGG